MAGLPQTLFDDPNSTVQVVKAIRLLNLAARQADCPQLGLLCGQRHQPETIGIVGRLARNARDIGSALRGLALNLHLNGHAFAAALTVSGDTAEFSLRLATEVRVDTRVTVDLGLAGAFEIVRTICGPRWSPTGVQIVHAPEGSRQPYDRYYGVHVQFGSDRNAIVFPAQWLGRPVHNANPERLALLERELAVMAQQNRLPPVAAARRILLACVARGDMSAAAVASAMGMHPRSLNRLLALEGTSVFELMKEVRFQIARDLLANTSLSIGEIAATLVYANIGAFTRAFRLWSGFTPSDWRRANATPACGPARRKAQTGGLPATRRMS